MFEIYNVKEGETIDVIANNYNTNPDYIFKLNGFNYDRNINTGENIIVPRLYNNYVDYYTIEKGINLEDFAKENNIDNRLLSNLNGLNTSDYLYPNQIIMIPKKDINYYITSNNDTVNNINKIMNSNINELLNQNNNLFLKEGQLIIYKEK